MTRYPLSWPAGWKRTHEMVRMSAKFKTISSQQKQWSDGNWYTSKTHSTVSVAEGVKRILNELRMMGIKEGDAIISTNVEVRLDGLPRSDRKSPTDPGVAVYWIKRNWKTHKVMAIDQYDTVGGNLAAIAATLDAMRAIERHGGAQILERAFIGFEALPEPKDWRKVLGVNGSTTLEEVKMKYRQLAGQHHPDLGGSSEKMAEINRAWSDAQRELG